MRGFGETKPSRKGSGERIENLVPTIPWPTGDYETVRIIGPVFAYCNIWFKIRTQKKPEGQNIPKLCLDLDGETDTFATDICPYRASGRGREAKWYAVNVIVRSLQQDSRGNTLQFKRPEILKPSEHHDFKGFWGDKSMIRNTPVRVLIVPESAAEKIQNMRKLNKIKGEAYDIGDAKFGCDIQIMDTEKPGAAKYDVQKGDRTPLTDAERRYVIFPLDLLKPERVAEAKREMADLETKLVKDEKKGDKSPRRGRDEDDEQRPARRGRDRDEDPDEDDVAEFDDTELDEDEMEDRPRNKKGGKPAKNDKRRSRDEDEDEDTEDDDLDADLEDGDDGDDAGEDDDDNGDDDLDADLDDDGDGDDEEEEERPKRSSGGRDRERSGRGNDRRSSGGGSSRPGNNRNRNRR